MARSALAFALVFLIVSWADARDICIQHDTGIYAGSQVVLKRVRLARRAANPLNGYLAFYSSGTGSFSSFYPVSGEALVNPVNQVVLGMTRYAVQIGPTSAGSSSSGNLSYNLACNMGPDAVLDELDACNGSIGGDPMTGHVVGCDPIVALP